jgi:hypothetical protein
MDSRTVLAGPAVRTARAQDHFPRRLQSIRLAAGSIASNCRTLTLPQDNSKHYSANERRFPIRQGGEQLIDIGQLTVHRR